MKKLIYKSIEFDDFQLYREAENSSGCEYVYPSEVETLNGFTEVDVYICPHCIKKHNLYAEADTDVETVEKYISGEYDDGDMSMTCGIKGCYNKNSFDGWIFRLDECTLLDITEKEYYVYSLIPLLKDAKITLEKVSEEIDYRERAGIDADEKRNGWDDTLYPYSTNELLRVEQYWNEK